MTIAIIIAAIGWALIPEILWARRLRKANARIAELEALQQSRDERGRFKALKTKKVGA